jgi:K(+)-stimulated pyrophosphate-energized sodium pump
LLTGVSISSVLFVFVAIFIVNILFSDSLGLIGAIIVGIVSGLVIGHGTEYYTSESFKPTIRVAESSSTGAGTLVISGIANGMMSVYVPVLAVSVTMMLSFVFLDGFVHLSRGLYGIGIASVAMLSTLGITLAADAYGPIADNAGGNAEMAGLGEEVRNRTDALDALGNTTAAIGKGFAIGSAALTALVLLAAYVEELRASMQRLGYISFKVGDHFVDVASAGMHDFMLYFDVTLMNPNVLIGIFLGGMLAFVFSAMTMDAVGRAAQAMVEEVRRQFREIKGILEGTGKPDYAACVEISTVQAQKEMLTPTLLVIFSPIVIGLVLGVPGVFGLMVGGLTTGFTLAVMLNNAGGSWDNAKKYIESGNVGGKGSDNHKAAVVGDTIGDPFKDTAGPSLNILIKLMAMVSVVFAGVVLKYSAMISGFLHLN